MAGGCQLVRAEDHQVANGSPICDDLRGHTHLGPVPAQFPGHRDPRQAHQEQQRQRGGLPGQPGQSDRRGQHHRDEAEDGVAPLEGGLGHEAHPGTQRHRGDADAGRQPEPGQVGQAQFRPIAPRAEAQRDQDGEHHRHEQGLGPASTPEGLEGEGHDHRGPRTRRPRRPGVGQLVQEDRQPGQERHRQSPRRHGEAEAAQQHRHEEQCPVVRVEKGRHHEAHRSQVPSGRSPPRRLHGEVAQQQQDDQQGVHPRLGGVADGERAGRQDAERQTRHPGLGVATAVQAASSR